MLWTVAKQAAENWSTHKDALPGKGQPWLTIQYFHSGPSLSSR
jgi:hypothetical protein